MQSEAVRLAPRYERPPATETAHSPRLSLLGGFELACNGRSLTLPAHARRLLALVAVVPLRLDREQAAEELWPDADPARSASRLRDGLWRLRETCPALVLEEDSTLALGPELEVDLQDLALLARVLSDPDETDPPPLDVVPRRFLGELLRGWDEPWLLVERERVRGLALQVLERLAVRLATARRFVEAFDAAYLTVGADPLRESAVQVLMRVHFAMGNRVDALRVYRAFAQRLRDELGPDVRPLPETTRILVEGFRLQEAGADAGDGVASLLGDG